MHSLDQLRIPLARYFTARLGGEAPTRVTAIERIATGHSRAMLGVDVGAGDGEAACRRFVVRVEQGGVFGTDSAEEVRIMRTLRVVGFPVARVRWYEPDRAVIGAPFFVMDREGGADERTEESLHAFIDVLARLHNLDWRRAGLGFLRVPRVPKEAALFQVERWEGVYHRARYLPVPLLDEGAAWLRRHAPAAKRIAFVHGDPGPSNFLHQHGRVTIVTDWEFAHLGDPVEDWVYLATMRGAGMLSREQWADLLKRAGSVEIDDHEWTFWEAFNLFKGACANLTALRLFEEGINPAPNMAAIGTALHLNFLQRLSQIVGAQ
jgi:aminoglycoside phosphotransferase (APT) family kinase protein